MRPNGFVNFEYQTQWSVYNFQVFRVNSAQLEKSYLDFENFENIDFDPGIDQSDRIRQDRMNFQNFHRKIFDFDQRTVRIDSIVMDIQKYFKIFILPIFEKI